MYRLLAALALAAPLAAFAGTAIAADVPMEEPVAVQAQNEGWLVTLKGTGVWSQRFEASNKYRLSGYPGISIRRPGQPWKFGAPDDGFGFAVVDTPWFQLGPVARIRGERDWKDDKKFRGMDNVDWAIEPGAFLELYPADFFRVRGELRYGTWGYDGFVGNVSADYINRFDRFTLSVGPRMEIGGKEFMNTYYGVSANEAAFNGRVTRYKADGGVKSVGVAGALTYDWSQNWSTTGFASYNRLVGDAADSPVAKKLGEKDSYSVGLGVAYTFSVNWK